MRLTTKQITASSDKELEVLEKVKTAARALNDLPLAFMEAYDDKDTIDLGGIAECFVNAVINPVKLFAQSGQANPDILRLTLIDALKATPWEKDDDDRS
jgi:hypothetical protein